MPRFSFNNIHDERQAGVLFAEGGSALMEDNNVHHCSWSAVQSEGPSAPVLRRNLLHSNGGAGYIAYNGGSGQFEHNLVYGNAKYAVQVKSEASPVVENNVLHDALYAIFVQGASGTFANNTLHIEATDMDEEVAGDAMGIFISSDSSPTLADNTSHLASETLMVS